MENAPPDIIVQSLRRIMIMGEKNDEAIENVARKVLSEVAERLNLQFQSIKAFNKNNTANISDVMWTKGIKHKQFSKYQFKLFLQNQLPH